ncbi:MAG: 4-vinyl reductase [Chloroflexi bacterium GWB2_49_20]|nr:MAG: 4-vinyl reductase [Chloroflexi bacterium GWB2_49_20]OGN78502.1 MAG: 4-vinyl reductase [Chloroflexi bacterium GWC2_49_37]OGN84035.1 MAG: 4-vinyl reductase [Chloroflexi bacterium GWD2_49_16]HBG75323.1 4-vinyl reductase [Anaerolineae bacterium]HCC79043.1 4-vinyl reductase [Anaerolineae bacterium]
MEQIPKSGFYYANRFALTSLEAYEGVMGKNGFNAILNLAGLSHLIENYPQDNLEREFDFADFTAIHIALEELYGLRGGRGLALHAGRKTFNDLLKNFGALAGVGDMAFTVLPLQTKLRIGLPSAAKIFSQVTDQYSTVTETDDEFLWTIHRCPICWSRKDSDKPICYISIGILQAMLTWISGGLEFRVNESKCKAMGEEVCEFIIQKAPITLTI